MSKNEINTNNEQTNPNIKELQKETLKICTMSQELLEELSKREKEKKDNNNSDKTLSLENLNTYQDILKNEIQKLKNLEYVIAVVGTMKAGKSMTINAIVGQEILPSREFPMTTLPTLITHVPNKTEPTLIIKKIKPFNTLKEEIKVKLKNDSSVLSSLGEIKELAEKINNNEIKFQQKYEGQENISKFLKEINDLMRIAKELELNPPYAEYTDVDDLPRIEVEFYHLKKHNQNASEAKLTLLDTPGPDEVKQSALLKKIFDEQLQRASAVTLVVDYTKMNNESDADVKEQVKDVAHMLGKKHLFVLLNKFDQRKRKKGNEEASKREAKELIVQDILKDKVKNENVFPISSKYAFYSNIGLREIEYKKEISTNLPWVEEFGTTILGEAWEDDIDDIKRVEKKCTSYWEKSFFEEPLNNIISSIHSEAPLMALDSPLTKVEDMFHKINNAFKTDYSALTTDIETLQSNIDEVKKSIDSSQNISTNLRKEIDKKSKENSRKINKKVESYIKEYINYFEKELEKKTEEKKKNEEKISKTGKVEIRNDNFSWLNKTLWEGGLFGGLKAKNENIDSLKKLQTEGELIFNDKDKAKSFLDNIKEAFLKELEKFPRIIQNETNKEINELSLSINKEIEEKMSTLIQKISKNLGDNISIILPQLDTNNFNIEGNIELNENIKTKSHTYTEQGDGIVNSVLNFLNRDWGLEKKKEKSYLITKEDISKNINEELNTMANTIKKNIESIYKMNIQDKVDNHLTNLLKEIKGYQEEQKSILNSRQEKQVNTEQELSIIVGFLTRTEKLLDRSKLSKKLLIKGKDNV